MAQCYVHATKIFKRNKKSSNFKDTTTASKRHLSISLSHKQLHRAKYCQHINSVLSESWFQPKKSAVVKALELYKYL